MLDQSGESLLARIEVLEALAGLVAVVTGVGPVVIWPEREARIRRTRELLAHEVRPDQVERGTAPVEDLTVFAEPATPDGEPVGPRSETGSVDGEASGPGAEGTQSSERKGRK